MYIRRVRLENVRCFGEGEHALDLDLKLDDGGYAGWVVVAGPNGSGKTTLLQAMALAVAGPPTQAALTELAPDDWMASGGAQARTNLSMEVHTEDAFLRSAMMVAEHPDPFTFRTVQQMDLRWSLGRPPGPLLPAEFLIASFHGPEQLGPIVTPAQNGPWVQSGRPMGWLALGYGPFRRLARGSTDAQRLSEARGTSKARLVGLFQARRYLRVDRSLASGAEALSLESGQVHYFKPTRPRLDDVIALLNDGLLPAAGQIAEITAEGLWVETAAGTRRLERLSDGYQVALGMAVDILRQIEASYFPMEIRQVDGRWQVLNEGVVLIDEAELHLHPEWQRRLGGWFTRVFPRMQFIVTTHSPLICQTASPGGLIRLPGPGDDQPARKVTGDEYEQVVNGTADDAYATLFEVPLRSERAEALLNRVAELESKILDDEATDDEVAEYQAKKAQLPASAELTRLLKRLDN